MYLKDKGVAELFITLLFYDKDFIRGSTTLYNTSAKASGRLATMGMSGC